MLIFTNFIILLLIDTFVILTVFSIFVCTWILLLYFVLINTNVVTFAKTIHLDFVSSNYLDIYWFSLGILFMSALLLRLCILLYFNWLSLVIFDLCNILGFQWYWVFFIFNDTVIFSNLLVESDYFIGDLRLLQCNNLLHLLSLTLYNLWLTSVDVIHSFTISTLGINVDCIPGSCNELLIFSTLPGTYYGSCSELCGVLHGFMPIVVEFL